MEILNWKEALAPVIVKSSKVEPTAANLRSVFQYFRKTLVQISEEPSNSSWMYFPGVFSTSRQKLERYAELRDAEGLDAKTAYPRGWLDSPVVVCGIAPGITVERYQEAMWLFGPSSARIHEAVGFPEFFTNVSHDAFAGNTYDREKALQEKHILEQELEIIQPKVVLLLGMYDVYKHIILPEGTRKVQVYHPSYIRKHLDLEPGWKSKIGEALDGYSKRVLEYKDCDLDRYFEPVGVKQQFLVSEKLKETGFEPNSFLRN